MCFFRRRDLPNPLVQLADKHQGMLNWYYSMSCQNLIRIQEPTKFSIGVLFQSIWKKSLNIRSIYLVWKLGLGALEQFCIGLPSYNFIVGRPSDINLFLSSLLLWMTLHFMFYGPVQILDNCQFWGLFLISFKIWTLKKWALPSFMVGVRNLLDNQRKSSEEK